MTTIMYVSAILAVVIILTIIGVLSRYRRCKPNQVLVVYGKTGGEKKPTDLRPWWKQQNPILRSPSSTRWLISGKKLPENRLRHLSTLTSEISQYLTAVRTVPVISLTMLSRPSLRHWESLISFRLQIL